MSLLTSLPTILHAYWLLIKWDWRISKQPYKKWKQHLDSSPVASNNNNPNNKYDPYPQQKYREISVLFAKVTRHHYRPMNCLRRSLALKELLLSNNIPSNLHIGVRFESSPEQKIQINPETNPTKKNILQAHAWLTINGFIINDSKEVVSSYTEITSQNQFFQSSLSSL